MMKKFANLVFCRELLVSGQYFGLSLTVGMVGDSSCNL